jgi:hypothetical protein
VISLIPNRAALFQAMEVAGLENVRVLEPAADHNIQYRRADRSVFVGYKRTA